jgi:hypothetical protein
MRAPRRARVPQPSVPGFARTTFRDVEHHAARRPAQLVAERTILPLHAPHDPWHPLHHFQRNLFCNQHV